MWHPLGPLEISPIATLKRKDLLLPIHEPRNIESTFEDRHKVTARSRLEAIERATQRAEAPGIDV
jgi:hypothetical protein